MFVTGSAPVRRWPREAHSQPPFRVSQLVLHHQMKAALGSRTREFDIEIMLHLGSPSRFRFIGPTQEVVLADSVVNEMLQNISPQDVTDAVCRIGGIKAFLQGVDGVLITQAKLGGDNLAIQLQEPEFEPVPGQQEPRQLVVKLTASRNVQGSRQAPQLPMLGV